MEITYVKLDMQKCLCQQGLLRDIKKLFNLFKKKFIEYSKISEKAKTSWIKSDLKNENETSI